MPFLPITPGVRYCPRVPQATRLERWRGVDPAALAGVLCALADGEIVFLKKGGPNPADRWFPFGVSLKPCKKGSDSDLENPLRDVVDFLFFGLPGYFLPK